MVSRTKTSTEMHIETQMEDIRKDLQELTGLTIPIPRVKISDDSGKFSGYIEAVTYQFGFGNPSYLIIIYNKDSLLKGVSILAHEMYHIAHEEYRRINEGPDSAAKYAGKASDIRTKILRNGMNEAGAYIYGFKSELQKGGLKGKELAGVVLQRIVDWSNTTIDSSRDEVLDLLFTNKSTELENKKLEEIKSLYDFLIREVKTVLIVAAITLEQNGFDADKAAKHLLQDPFKTIDEITSMGREKVVESLERAEEFLAEIKKRNIADCLRK